MNTLDHTLVIMLLVFSYIGKALVQVAIDCCKTAVFPVLIPIPVADNTTAIYAGAMVKGAAHPQAASAWLEFIHSPTAMAIFERYDFKPYKG